jgi:hypothetical protein
MNRLLKEPLLHFLLIGAGLFLLFGWRGNSASVAGGQAGTPLAQIEVSRDALERINSQFEKTWQRRSNAAGNGARTQVA